MIVRGTTVARCAAVVLLSFLAHLLGAAPAGAHASLLGSDPANGAILHSPPPAVKLMFNEPVVLEGGSARVHDDTGAAVSTGAQVLDSTVEISLPSSLDDGTYLVAWELISIDSHRITGSITFHVGAPTLAAAIVPAPQAAASEPIRAATSALMYFCLLGATGTALFARRWTQRADVPVERVERLSRWLAFGGLVLVLIDLAVRVASLGGRWSAMWSTDAITTAVDGPVAWSALSMTVGLGLLGFGLSRGTCRSWVMAAGAALALAGPVLEGHTRSADPAILVVVGDVVHLLAGAVWLGGVAALLVALRSIDQREPAWRAVSDVSLAALAAVVAVTASGVAMAWSILPTFDALTDTRWGVALLVKLGLVAALLALGAYHRFRVLPGLGRQEGPEGVDRCLRTVRRTVGVELAVFVLLLGTTGVLVQSSPAMAEAAPAAEPTPFEETVPLTSDAGTVTFTGASPIAGYSDVNVAGLSSDGQPLRVEEPPIFELSEPDRGIGPIIVPPHEIAPGQYHLGVLIPFEGDWVLTARFRTGTFETGTASIPLPLG